MKYFLGSGLQRERIATQCVCCGKRELQSSPAILMPFVTHRVFGWRPVVIDETWGLRTIANGHAYSICNSLYCESCEFLFLDIRFTDDELSRLYRDYRGHEYVALREHYEPGYEQRNENLKNCAPYTDQVEDFISPYLTGKPRILDWGGDTGKNSPFREENEFLHIYDISQMDVVPDARSVSKEETLSWKYDLIVCSEVLEHTPYPSDMLMDIRERMGEQTILYVEVPHEFVMQSDMRSKVEQKKHWHEHINFFSLRALGNLLAACDFYVVEMRSSPIVVAGAVVDVIQVLARKLMN
ncbi:class I SAM-dependent methyltransferase [Stutzerimonas chloritidismutans]|uniref:class I SAM-dependent methyltransferase n=1 Tax=Stutzerimonas chloritidismutans TaxID=203192 RepID=UPI003F1650DB